MRLERDDEAALRPTAARGFEHRFEFLRVVAVVVDQLHFRAVRGRELAEQIEAAADTRELL